MSPSRDRKRFQRVMRKVLLDYERQAIDEVLTRRGLDAAREHALYVMEGRRAWKRSAIPGRWY